MTKGRVCWLCTMCTACVYFHVIKQACLSSDWHAEEKIKSFWEGVAVLNKWGCPSESVRELAIKGQNLIKRGRNSFSPPKLANTEIDTCSDSSVAPEHISNKYFTKTRQSVLPGNQRTQTFLFCWRLTSLENLWVSLLLSLQDHFLTEESNKGDV